MTIGEDGRLTVVGDAVSDALTHRRTVGEVEAKRLLAELGLAVPLSRLAHSANEAARAAEEIGFPVVVKVASPDILHKSDVGGVALNVSTAEQARAATYLIRDQGDRYVQAASMRQLAVMAGTVDPAVAAELLGVAAALVPGIQVIKRDEVADTALRARLGEALGADRFEALVASGKRKDMRGMYATVEDALGAIAAG